MDEEDPILRVRSRQVWHLRERAQGADRLPNRFTVLFSWLRRCLGFAILSLALVHVLPRCSSPALVFPSFVFRAVLLLAFNSLRSLPLRGATPFGRWVAVAPRVDFVSLAVRFAVRFPVRCSFRFPWCCFSFRCSPCCSLRCPSRFTWLFASLPVAFSCCACRSDAHDAPLFPCRGRRNHDGASCGRLAGGSLHAAPARAVFPGSLMPGLLVGPWSADATPVLVHGSMRAALERSANQGCATNPRCTQHHVTPGFVMPPVRWSNPENGSPLRLTAPRGCSPALSATRSQDVTSRTGDPARRRRRFAQQSFMARAARQEARWGRDFLHLSGG